MSPLEKLKTALADRYRIDRELGAGGMATVYLASDLKHDRKVAIKVLKPELAAVLGAERFVVEIKTTAALQHPHILPLFDSGTADGFLFYVMPYIEGETIREKLNRETQFGVDEAVRITREIADALEYAHRHGVIHRDIKPENILLHDGRAMVMDFGIALAVSAAAGGRMTETGLSLGTPHYMSPEQATAEKGVSGRSDIYSLASMLYEMLSGDPPHTGASAQQIIMKIITAPAEPVTKYRASVPANVAAAIAKSLEKLPADRFESARAFSEALGDRGFTAHGVGTSTVAVTPGASRRVVVAAGIVAIASLGVALWMWKRSAADVAPPVALTLDVPSGNLELSRFAVSGDGSKFAFATAEGIAVRDAGQREYRVLPGTEAGESPAFSPDGDWLVYESSGVLRKALVSGGVALSLIANDSIRSGRVSWGDDGTIVFETGGRLAIIPPNGTLRILFKAEGAEQPRMTPDGRGVLYVNQVHGAKLMYYDIAADTAFAVLDGAEEAQLLPSEELIYGAGGGGLYTIHFDRRKHAVSGTPSPVVQDMQPNGAVAPFVVTRGGMLVYRAGVDAESRVVMRDARGKIDTLPLGPRVLSYLRFSPDGHQMALTIGSARGTNRHTALYDFSRGTLTQFTGAGGGHSPVWSPDGKQLAWTMEGPDTDAEDLVVQPLDQSRPPTHMPKLPNDQHASAWPTDTMLVFASNHAPRALRGNRNTGRSSYLNPVTGAGVHDFLTAQWGEYDPAVSPDGQWVAFTSHESGRPEIHVRRFPRPEDGGQWKISTGGGEKARWSADGRTIYYLTGDHTILRATAVTPGAAFAVGSSSVVMTAREFGVAWDLDRATGRIAMSVPVSSAGVKMIVIQNWRDAFTRSAKK